MAHPGGRPLAYQSASELEAAVNAYFADCDSKIINKQVVQKGIIVEVPTPTPYTMAGLARALNVDRMTLIRYGDVDNRPEYCGIIAQARKKIEESNVTLALVGCHESRIAALNLTSNYGYGDRVDIDLTNREVSTLEDEQADQIVEEVTDRVLEKMGKGKAE